MKWYELGPIAWAREYINTHPRFENFLSQVILPPEAVIKKTLFGCQSCGQCLLHENGYTCPMRCPKTQRNGPCGGVRANGHCEVYPERWCVWYRAYYRSKSAPMPQAWRDDMYKNHAPVNWELINTSSFLNVFTGRDHGVKSHPPTEKKPAAKPEEKKAAPPAAKA
jgi:hypothetical protein